MRVVPALANDPVLLTGLHVTLERCIIVANHALYWIIEAITDVVGALWNEAWSLNVVHNERLAIRADALEYLSVKATVLLR